MTLESDIIPAYRGKPNIVAGLLCKGVTFAGYGPGLADIRLVCTRPKGHGGDHSDGVSSWREMGEYSNFSVGATIP